MSADLFDDVNGRDVLGGHANANGRVLFTRDRRHWTWPSRRPRSPRTGGKPGSRMIATAMALLFVLGAGLLAVSLAAQYTYVLGERHQRPAALIEALALDVGMLIFSLLALGLARSGKAARVERTLIIACAAGSALMNFAPADSSSWRSVLSFVMPPIFLAVVADRVISVVRRAWLDSDEASAWRPAGRAAVLTVRGSGIAALYALRLVLAPRSTLAGGRRAVLLATPVPAAEEPPAIEAADTKPSASRFAYCAKCGRYIICSPSGDWLMSDRRGGEDNCRPSPTVTEDRADGGGAEAAWRWPRAGSKTAKFLVAVEDKHGPMRDLDLDALAGIAAEVAPPIELDPGSARRELRAAVLAAKQEARR